MSATCRKRFSSKNFLQHCLSDFVDERADLEMYSVLVLQCYNIKTSKISVSLSVRAKMLHSPKVLSITLRAFEIIL